MWTNSKYKQLFLKLKKFLGMMVLCCSCSEGPFEKRSSLVMLDPHIPVIYADGPAAGELVDTT